MERDQYNSSECRVFVCVCVHVWVYWHYPQYWLLVTKGYREPQVVWEIRMDTIKYAVQWKW